MPFAFATFMVMRMNDLVEQLMFLLKEKNMKLATAESCTGGMLAATITHKAGASHVFERGFVTYSNDSKMEMLGVPKQMIDMNGAVSAQVAEAMARGALKNSHAHLGVSITGIAGPEGGTPQKPVGTVFMGYALKNGSAGSVHNEFTGSRQEIQAHSVHEALKHLIFILQSA